MMPTQERLNRVRDGASVIVLSVLHLKWINNEDDKDDAAFQLLRGKIKTKHWTLKKSKASGTKMIM